MIHALGTALALGAPPAAATPARPLHLVTEATAEGVRMRVVGHSPVQCDSSYVLDVTNDAATASNRSVQRGTARLRPGARAIVATLSWQPPATGHGPHG